jgi:hypothetical protein
MLHRHYRGSGFACRVNPRAERRPAPLRAVAASTRSNSDDMLMIYMTIAPKADIVTMFAVSV